MLYHKVEENGMIHIHTERERERNLPHVLNVCSEVDSSFFQNLWLIQCINFLSTPRGFISLIILQTTLNDRTNSNHCSLTINKQNSLRVAPLLYMWSWRLQWNKKRFNDFQMAFSQAGMCYVMSFGNLVQCEHQNCLAWDRGWMPLALKALSSCWTGKV